MQKQILISKYQLYDIRKYFCSKKKSEINIKTVYHRRDGDTGACVPIGQYVLVSHI
jgi:hypothetical protein